MKLSVVIPCLNGAGTLAAQLDALANQQWSQPWEVVIADNGSTDESVAIAQGFQRRIPSLRIVDASGRRGQPYALNAGAAAAKGEAVAFTDADDEVAPGWVAAMGDALAVHDFVACRVDVEKLNPPGKRMRSSQSRGLQRHSYPPYLPHAGGGTLGIKRRLFEGVGGFDESLPYLHDTDLCWRVQLAGTELHFVPDAVVHVRQRHSYFGRYRQAIGWAEYAVLLHKRYQPLGMPRLSWRQGLKSWKNLAWMLTHIRNREDMTRCAWEVGWRLGRVRGSIKHRVLSL
jgi:glycosyltransferase involved in cell wall biosynthesis